MILNELLAEMVYRLLFCRKKQYVFLVRDANISEGFFPDFVQLFPVGWIQRHSVFSNDSCVNFMNPEFVLFSDNYAFRYLI